MGSTRKCCSDFEFYNYYVKFRWYDNRGSFVRDIACRLTGKQQLFKIITVVTVKFFIAHKTTMNTLLFSKEFIGFREQLYNHIWLS